MYSTPEGTYEVSSSDLSEDDKSMVRWMIEQNTATIDEELEALEDLGML